MNGNSTQRVRLEAGGDGVVAHVGLHALQRVMHALKDWAEEHMDEVLASRARHDASAS